MRATLDRGVVTTPMMVAAGDEGASIGFYPADHAFASTYGSLLSAAVPVPAPSERSGRDQQQDDAFGGAVAFPALMSGSSSTPPSGLHRRRRGSHSHARKRTPSPGSHLGASPSRSEEGSMVTRSSSVGVKPWHLRLPTCTPEAEVASPPPRQAGKVSGGVSSLQFADELLARASYTPPLTAGGTRTRSEIMESVGVLKRNADLVDVVNGIQQTHLCFQEVASEAATYRPHLSRVLSKVMAGYARLFERLLGLMVKSQLDADGATAGKDRRGTSGGQGTEALENKVAELLTVCKKREDLLLVRGQQVEAGNAQLEVMERELDTLRGILVKDLHEVARDTQLRRDEENGARKLLELEIHRSLRDSESQNSVGYLGDKFGLSVGTLGDVIDDVEKRRSEQVDILRDMGDLLKHQSACEENQEAVWQRKVSGLESQLFAAKVEARRATEKVDRLESDNLRLQDDNRKIAVAAAERLRVEMERREADRSRTDGGVPEVDIASLVVVEPSGPSSEDEEGGEEPPPCLFNACTQTVVDPDGLWEAAGDAGHEVAMSGRAMAALEREKALEAQRKAKCTRCRATFDLEEPPSDELEGPSDEGAAVAGEGLLADEQGPLAVLAAANTASTKSRRRTIKGAAAAVLAGTWGISSEVRHFLGNLSRMVEAQPIKPLNWLVKELGVLYEQKTRADYLDEREGSPLQTLQDFLTEYLLMRYELRRIAEMHMYELLMSVKEHWRTTPQVFMFAQFLRVVTVPGKPSPDIEVLKAYLYTRKRLVRTRSRYAEEQLVNQIQLEEAAAMTLLGGAGRRGSVAAPPPPSHASQPPPPPPPTDLSEHTVTDAKGTSSYVPLEHAIEVVMDVCSFMTPRKLANHLRDMERAVAVVGVDGKAATPTSGTGSSSGMRSSVRRATQTVFDLRASKLVPIPETGKKAETKNATTPSESGAAAQDQQFVVNVDVALQVVVQILLVRQKQVHDGLVRKFVEGDDNGDGVLSYAEFHGIVTRHDMAPHFSERKTLRMFKAALTRGEDNSTAIERPAFVGICQDYGLGKLVDTTLLDASLLDDVRAATQKPSSTSTGAPSK